MTVVIPRSDLTLEKIEQLRQITIRGIEEAIKSKGKNPEDYIITDALPKEDFGLPNNEWKITYTAAYTEETKVNLKVPEDKFIGIYGVAIYSAVPITTYIKFKKGVNTLAVYELEKLFMEDVVEGYFKFPIIYRENDDMKIDFHAVKAGDEYIVLKAFVATKEKERISTKPAEIWII